MRLVIKCPICGKLWVTTWRDRQVIGTDLCEACEDKYAKPKPCGHTKGPGHGDGNICHSGKGKE